MAKKVSSEKLAIEGGAPVRTAPLPLEHPGAHWVGQEELDAVAQVLKAKSLYRYCGLDHQHMVDNLEAAFNERLGRKHALATASGTTALSTAFAALGVGPGDEVLMPGYSWVSCLSAVVRLGAIPRLVDIDDTFCMSPEDLERKIGPNSRVALLVHMSGAPGDLDPLLTISRRAGLKIVEDCAQANGACYKGRPVGCFGDLAIFSFQINKNATAGEGGVVVCDDEDLYNRCFAAHDMGYARNDKRGLVPEDERYLLWGIGCRMSEPNGALALTQLRKLDRITGAMRTAKWAIREQLAEVPGLEFRRIVDRAGDAGPFLITILETPECSRRFVDALCAEGIRGPEASQTCIPMEEWHLHWYFNNLSLVRRASLNARGWPWTDPANAFAKAYQYGRGALPVCDDLASRSILLTIASCLTEKDIDDIVTAYRKVARALL